MYLPPRVNTYLLLQCQPWAEQGVHSSTNTVEPDEELVQFLRQSGPGMLPMLGLDGSCVIACGSELWQRASWAVVAHDSSTTKGIVYQALNRLLLPVTALRCCISVPCVQCS